MKNFKEFVFDTLDEILIISDLPHFGTEITFCEEELGNNGEICAIYILPEYQTINVNVYGRLEQFYKEGDLDRVYHTLCHEVGHIHTAKLYRLVERSYKSEEEANNADEELSTKIGYYLFKLLQNKWGKDKCKKKKHQHKKRIEKPKKH